MWKRAIAKTHDKCEHIYRMNKKYIFEAKQKWPPFWQMKRARTAQRYAIPCFSFQLVTTVRFLLFYFVNLLSFYRLNFLCNKKKIRQLKGTYQLLQVELVININN